MLLPSELRPGRYDCGVAAPPPRKDEPVEDLTSEVVEEAQMSRRRPLIFGAAAVAVAGLVAVAVVVKLRSPHRASPGPEVASPDTNRRAAADAAAEADAAPAQQDRGESARRERGKKASERPAGAGRERPERVADSPAAGSKACRARWLVLEPDAKEKGAYVRTSPSRESGHNILREVPNCTQVCEVDNRGDWIRVQTKPGEVGWMRARYLVHVGHPRCAAAPATPATSAPAPR
jgi:hypothetical protein